jgi:hypothetical protein
MDFVDVDVGDCASELVADIADEVGEIVPLLCFKLEHTCHVGTFVRWGVPVGGREDGECWLVPVGSGKVLELL